MLFTSKDTSAGEETFFTCFKIGDKVKGTYQEVLLRAVLEATMSAPTYFSPFERFVDGGTTSYNNPVLAAVLEALTYDGEEKYKMNELTVFSFGTSSIFHFLDSKEIENPKGLDLKFWLNYVMDESSKDASEMQINLLRSKIFKQIDFRRYQLSLDEEALKKIPDMSIDPALSYNKEWLHELTNKELSKIDMADVTKFPLMRTIGNAVVEYICPKEELDLPMSERKANWFQKDFIDSHSRRGSLVTAHGDVEANKSHLKNSKWIESRNTK